LGGNAPVLVFDDANLDQAVEGIIASKFRNSGQTRVCANRIYVQSGVYDEVAKRLASAVAGLKTGNGMDTGIMQGPLINAAAVAKVRGHIDDAVRRGARVIAGGRPHALGGNFFEPTVIVDVTSEMRFAREETFGPVAPLLRFDTEADAVSAANDSEFGLATYLFTANHARIWRVAEALECGMVGVNTGLMSSEVAPFGGIKQSGLGREGSAYGIDEYLELKYVCVDIRPYA
jgi:succinate-semialdehyde dehydrogenase / glutarate-semialdehyde dehydrogenase